MFWLLAFAALVFALASGFAYGTRRLGAAPPLPALPEAPSPLQMRLLDLDAALADVRAITRDVPAATLHACAARARGGGTGPLVIDRSTHGPFAPDIRVPAQGAEGPGPGTLTFAKLYTALERIDEEDQRTLVDAGLDPGRILGALHAPLAPQRWVTGLERTIDYFRSGLRRLSDRRYG